MMVCSPKSIPGRNLVLSLEREDHDETRTIY
jgi:hypothetical protein